MRNGVWFSLWDQSKWNYWSKWNQDQWRETWAQFHLFFRQKKYRPNQSQGSILCAFTESHLQPFDDNQVKSEAGNNPSAHHHLRSTFGFLAEKASLTTLDFKGGSANDQSLVSLVKCSSTCKMTGEMKADATAYDSCDWFWLLGLLERNFRRECHLVPRSRRQGV